MLSVSKAENATRQAETEFNALLEQYNHVQSRFQNLLAYIPVRERNYERSELEQQLIALVVHMSPPGGHRQFHGKLDCAKLDFTTLLATQHVERHPPPQEKVPLHDNMYGSYYRSDPAVEIAKRNAAAKQAALDAAKVSIHAIANHRSSRCQGRPPDNRRRPLPVAA